MHADDSYVLASEDQAEAFESFLGQDFDAWLATSPELAAAYEALWAARPEVDPRGEGEDDKVLGELQLEVGEFT